MHPLLLLAAVQAPPAPDFKALFGSYEGTFVARELRTGKSVVHNPARARKRFPPCSTYKIPHTIFALDSGIANATDTFKWDGVSRFSPDWNRDQTLESAVRHSAVWVFEEIAKRLGRSRSQSYVDRLKYGNRNLSAWPKNYWLMESLAISAEEQVSLLGALAQDKWPFDKSAQRQAKAWVLVEEGQGYRYYGKTGSGIEKGGKMQLGWWVGWIERPSETWVFAANYRGPDAMGHRLRPKMRQAFVQMGLLPRQ